MGCIYLITTVPEDWVVDEIRNSWGSALVVLVTVGMDGGLRALDARNSRILCMVFTTVRLCLVLKN